MTKYRVTFIYGTWHLWADIETSRIAPDDRKGFADLAENAVHAALDSISNIEQKHVAHDYTICEYGESDNGEMNISYMYGFDTLATEKTA